MVRSKKTERKHDQSEDFEFTDTVRGRSILRAIKKYLDEQPGGTGRSGKIKDYVVNDKGIISEKGFKNYLRQFLQEGKVEKIEGVEAKRLSGYRWPLYCMPDWVKKEQYKKEEIDDLKKSRCRYIDVLKQLIPSGVSMVQDRLLVEGVWDEYSKLTDLNARLRIRQEFTGDRASPEFQKLAKVTIPKMIDDLFAIFKNKKFSKKRRNKMLDDLLDLILDAPRPKPIYQSEFENRLLPNIR